MGSCAQRGHTSTGADGAGSCKQTGHTSTGDDGRSVQAEGRKDKAESGNQMASHHSSTEQSDVIVIDSDSDIDRDSDSCIRPLMIKQGNSVSVSVSAQDGIVALGKAHTRSAPPLSSLPKVACETVSTFTWLNTDRSLPWRRECWPLPFFTPLSFK